MTDDREYRIKKLSGPKNWPKFEREMMGKYVLDDVDQIVLGLKIRPITPMDPTEVYNATDPQAKAPTKQEKDAYEKELAE